MGNLHIPPAEWLKELFQYQNCDECHRGARSHDAVPLLGNWFARCRPTNKRKNESQNSDNVPRRKTATGSRP